MEVKWPWPDASPPTLQNVKTDTATDLFGFEIAKGKTDEALPDTPALKPRSPRRLKAPS